MHADEILPDLLLAAFSQALDARRPDVADHILSAIEKLTEKDVIFDQRNDAYRMIAGRH